MEIELSTIVWGWLIWNFAPVVIVLILGGLFYLWVSKNGEKND